MSPGPLRVRLDGVLFVFLRCSLGRLGGSCCFMRFSFVLCCVVFHRPLQLVCLRPSVIFGGLPPIFAAYRWGRGGKVRRTLFFHAIL